MSTYLMGQLATFYTDGAFAAILLCVGLAVGLVLGKKCVHHASSDRSEVKRLVGVLSQLADWTHGVADDMSQYRSVVSGVSDLFRHHPEELDEQKRTATLGLLSQVVEANEQLQNRLNQAECMLKQQAGEISTYMSEARTDALTGLPNRRALDEDMARRLAEWRRQARPLSVMMIDIDHFKKFNDTYGHQAGDAVLQQVAVLLRQTMRESDFVARFGGEEMAVILPGAEANDACLAAERTRQIIEEAAFTHELRQLHATVSVGAAQCLTNETAAHLIKRADEALYAAKQNGRNQAYWHDGHACRKVGGPVTAETERREPVRTRREEEATEPVVSQESFARVCQDLRRRLEEVSSLTCGGSP
jgi:diguanylate cyclase